MAFKMKGSPHKMGTIQGTSGHTSALKTKEDLQHLREMEHDEKGNHLGRYDRKKEMDESPLEQKKKLNLETIKEGFKGTDTEKAVKAVKKVAGKVKKFRKSLKPKSETTVSKELTKGRTKNKGTDNEYSQDKVKVTASTKGSKKKLFGGKKETTSSSSKTYDQDTYADGDVERGYGDGTKRGTTTTTHSRNKRRGGGKKKVVTVDQNTGKKTVTRYKKDGSVKSTKVKKGDYRTNTPTAEKKALREEKSPLEQTNPDAKKVIATKGKTTKYTKGGRSTKGKTTEKAKQTTYTKKDDGTYTKKVATAKKGATSDADLVTKKEKTISAKKAERQIKRKTNRAERSGKRADVKEVREAYKPYIKDKETKKQAKTERKDIVKAIRNR